MAGTTCVAEHPLPMTITFLSFRTRSFLQRAVWTTGPSNVSIPGMRHGFGCTRPPMADMRMVHS